ncbi:MULTISPECIES: glycosyltransferase family 2 protein [Streptosporangium]|uniref:CDP-glycerol glycerophosphotransferase n=1 Tax=Streptosporangium brasiliense TaxID=47480 RepID=A0ABT9R160_9ACTN|nr:glycosyltransferase [Streptosporangium brasiliense]MDP9862959.1 CDP-glycerol glycerophosphotransferase [Streptosporangium brasiliense]
MPRLSVIVPYYNVEPYFDDCLASIQGQTLGDLEVICVDDGSTDASAVIAKDYVSRDPRFRVVVQDNQGLGPARNTGVEHASGRYLAFADSDDIVPPRAYELLVDSLEQSGSDIASGNVQRLTSDGLVQSWAHRNAFKKTQTGTHITRNVHLLFDRSVWNKVFRRSFWDTLGMEFPARLYEDMPVTIPAHVRAQAVDVLSEVVYIWRLREGSITERRFRAENVTDLMISVMETASFLEEHAPGLRRVYERDTLFNDLRVAVEALAAGVEPDLLLDAVCSYLDTVRQETYLELPAIRRLQVQLMHRRKVAELAEAVRFERESMDETRIRRSLLSRRKWYADYPFRRGHGIPRWVFDVSRELTMTGLLEGWQWREGRLHGEGRVKLPGVMVGASSSCSIDLWLLERAGGTVLELPVEREDLGFAFVCDPGPLCEQAAKWELWVRFTVDGIVRETRLRGQTPALGPHVTDAGMWVQPLVDDKGSAVLTVKRPRAAVTGCELAGGRLRILGWHAEQETAEGVALVMSVMSGPARSYPVETTAGPEDRREFVMEVPAEDVRVEQETATWNMFLSGMADGRPLRMPVALHELPEWELDGWRIQTARTSRGNMALRVQRSEDDH